MSFKEIKQLRQEGKLDEALKLATETLLTDSENIWNKRGAAWVYYDFLKKACEENNSDSFLDHLVRLANLNLPADEAMVFDNACWQIGKMIFSISRVQPIPVKKIEQLFETVKDFHFTKPSESYSFLFKGLHKGLKESNRYIEFCDWWDFNNFRPEDFQSEKLPNGKEVMSIAEQAYINYAKALMPTDSFLPHKEAFIEKIHDFLPKLDKVIEEHPKMIYPPFFKAKLLLFSKGSQDELLSALIPFARKKKNEFWTWDILADAFPNEKDIKFSCYCRSLLCGASEEFVVGVRQKIASELIERKMFPEAKLEISKIVAVKTFNQHKIPNALANWQHESWFNSTEARKDNTSVYKQYAPAAEELLFKDLPEESIIVEFVNTEKKVLNFIASKEKTGFFKFERFLKKVEIGDVLKVRFQDHPKEGAYRPLTVRKADDSHFKTNFLKEIEGDVKIPEGKNFGFIENVFVPAGVVTTHSLTNGQRVKGVAMNTFEKKKNQWGWKLVNLL